jgi:hypothetical protein
MLINGIEFNCECGSCPTCDVIAREMDALKRIEFVCDQCFSIVRASYRRIVGLASFHEMADGTLSFNTYCGCCNDNTFHSTLE